MFVFFLKCFVSGMIYTYFKFSPYIPLEIISDKNDNLKQ